MKKRIISLFCALLLLTPGFLLPLEDAAALTRALEDFCT